MLHQLRRIQSELRNSILNKRFVIREQVLSPSNSFYYVKVEILGDCYVFSVYKDDRHPDVVELETGLKITDFTTSPEVIKSVKEILLNKSKN